ncbi:hypothetical protein ACN42_g3962 [Penicillium freii]|uniref:Uncharacterized protein n=1 Tax=Penicillium freii TaxID=48697 RepID=A0A117NPY6_PENFR|nr:hypothetical protein ACN42_g3962 [Penicillium freii]
MKYRALNISLHNNRTPVLVASHYREKLHTSATNFQLQHSRLMWPLKPVHAAAITHIIHYRELDIRYTL